MITCHKCFRPKKLIFCYLNQRGNEQCEKILGNMVKIDAILKNKMIPFDSSGFLQTCIKLICYLGPTQHAGRAHCFHQEDTDLKTVESAPPPTV